MNDFKENIKEIIWDELTREEISEIAMNWWGSLNEIEQFTVVLKARFGVFLDRSTTFQNVTENEITNIFWWHLVWGVLS